jgi:hypothetical protein
VKIIKIFTVVFILVVSIYTNINAETKEEIRFEQIKNKINSGAVGKMLLENENLCLEVYTRVIANSPDIYTFSTNFDTMDDITPVYRSEDYWKIENGNLITTGVKENGKAVGERRLVFGDTEWTDYTITTIANLKEDGRGYGVYYRADGEDDITGYIFQYDPGLGNKLVVRKVSDGKEAYPFQTIKMSEVFPDDFQVTDKDHKIEISVEGDRHIIKVDDIEVFNFEDDWRDKGCGGLRAWHNSTVEFDNITVK